MTTDPLYVPRDKRRYDIFLEPIIAEPELVASNLIREECDAKIKELMDDGISPNRITVKRIS